MLDLKFIRENLSAVKKAVQSKRESVDMSKFEQIDKKRREIIGKRDNLKKEHRKITEQIARFKRQEKSSVTLIQQSKTLGQDIKDMEKELRQIEQHLNEVMIWIPNIPHSSVPLTESIIVKEWGEKRKFDFESLSCFDICKSSGMVDFNAGTKMAGTNFPCYIGAGARLERALINFMLNTHIKKGYIEVFPPFIVSRDAMFGTGQIPKMEEDMYRIEKDDLFLNPTAEVPLINLHRNETLIEDKLPLKYVGYTACFRREAGSYGKETKGLKRVHQFNKVELIKFTHPESSYTELETMLTDAENILKMLGIPHRVRLLAANDMSFASTKTYDIEVFAPVTGEYLEVSSVSNSEAFQARRCGIRYKKKSGGTAFVHILNGSGLATPRTFMAVVENYQNKDGTISIPEVLKPYIN